MKVSSIRSASFTSQEVIIKSFFKGLHKSVNLFFILVMIKDKLTDSCGKLLLTKRLGADTEAMDSVSHYGAERDPPGA